jgi:thiol-disulfide isomerase/thioredoxin
MRAIVLALFALAAAGNVAAQCGSGSEVRKALREYSESARKASLAERRLKIDALAAQYPGAFEVQEARIQFYRWGMTEEFAAVREAAVKRAEADPSDPLALTVAAAALHRWDTPKAIKLLEKALQATPGYPWAAVWLAEIHQSGKFEDKAKARTNFEVFANACGGEMPRSLEYLMGKVAPPELQLKIARALRARLENETDPVELRAYEMPWGLEFRNSPPREHAALRKRVAADVERLSRLNVKQDAAYVALLKNGARQSGAPKEELEGYDERLLKEFPTSQPAYSVASERWRKDHKEPEDHKNKAAWDEWKTAYAEALKKWSAQFTEVQWLKDSYADIAMDTGIVGPAEAVRMLEERVRREIPKSGPSRSLWVYLDPASTLLEKGWEKEKALEWAERAWPLAEAEDRRQAEDDTLTEEQIKQIKAGGGYRSDAARIYLKALLVNGKKEVPAPLRAFVEGPAPGKKEAEWAYYWSRARLARIDGRAADALAYYQAALLGRGKAPQPYRGVARDELLADAKSCFFATGGSESAFALWSKPREAKPAELAGGHWEKPEKALPPFELADLSGATWKLKQLEGKALLINLWATWCGPCKAELPHLQKLYEKTKQRTDVQVLTFNIDEETGLVEPFLKEHGYNFPVLLAYGYVRDLLDGIGIPQNWIVDRNGVWLWTQGGFDASDADWVNTMLAKLEQAKEGK